MFNKNMIQKNIMIFRYISSLKLAPNIDIFEYEYPCFE